MNPTRSEDTLIMGLLDATRTRLGRARRRCPRNFARCKKSWMGEHSDAKKKASNQLGERLDAKSAFALVPVGKDRHQAGHIFG